MAGRCVVALAGLYYSREMYRSKSERRIKTRRPMRAAGRVPQAMSLSRVRVAIPPRILRACVLSIKSGSTVVSVVVGM